MESLLKIIISLEPYLTLALIYFLYKKLSKVKAKSMSFIKESKYTWVFRIMLLLVLGIGLVLKNYELCTDSIGLYLLGDKLAYYLKHREEIENIEQ